MKMATEKLKINYTSQS